VGGELMFEVLNDSIMMHSKAWDEGKVLKSDSVASDGTVDNDGQIIVLFELCFMMNCERSFTSNAAAYLHKSSSMIFLGHDHKLSPQEPDSRDIICENRCADRRTVFCALS
jgi:hypothetical protein